MSRHKTRIKPSVSISPEIRNIRATAMRIANELCVDSKLSYERALELVEQLQVKIKKQIDVKLQEESRKEIEEIFESYERDREIRSSAFSFMEELKE